VLPFPQSTHPFFLQILTRGKDKHASSATKSLVL
jgi:hypothetical protein